MFLIQRHGYRYYLYFRVQQIFYQLLWWKDRNYLHYLENMSHRSKIMSISVISQSLVNTQ